MPLERCCYLAPLAVLAPSIALAQEPATEPAPAITVGGYLEAFYQLHVQNPDNRITNLRGFDNRSRTFTLSNVALDVKGERGPIAARIVVQFGHTPDAYYSAADSDTWKYLQAAFVTAKAPRDVVIEAGLFPSPIGIEVFPIKDNWNWSRSNLFYGLPFYHTGVTVSRALGGDWTGKLHVYNGWNNVVDDNGYPSVALSAGYARDGTTAQLLYFGGIERAPGAAEGKPWRHLFDALAQHAISDTVTIAAQLDVGIEPNDVGTSSWYALAAYAKLAISDELYTAVRADYFHESVPSGAAAIFWPIEWVASGTATLAYQPVDLVSVRLEYRHDHAAADAFFAGSVATDPMTMAFVPDTDVQDTVTLGVTAWF